MNVVEPAESESYAPKAGRVIARCRELALCSEVEGETTRTFLAPSMRRVHTLLTGWMQAAGMQVRVDAAGNLRGELPAADPNAPRLLIGSHLDTVANAGAFDGILGVVLGVALAEETAADKLPFAVEVIGFSEEEGVRFAKPFLGSLALLGELDAATLALTDRTGVSVAEAIRDFGLDPADLPAAVLDPSVFAYLEFHIEQGPVLESEALALGVVDAIAGQTRMTSPSPATPTTPAPRPWARCVTMPWPPPPNGSSRSNATRSTPPASSPPSANSKSASAAGNVIAGEVTATLDVRHPDDPVRHDAVALDLLSAARNRCINVASPCLRPGPTFTCRPHGSRSYRTVGRRRPSHHSAGPRHLTSGAGHDAMILARRLPAAMLFLRSPGGLSHHPDEAVFPGDVEAALAAGVEFLRLLRDDKAMLERYRGRPSRPREDRHA